MIGSKYLLDTNIIIEIFRGNKGHADKINQLKGFYLSSVVLGELYVGVYRVANKPKYLKILAAFLKGSTILNLDDKTAIHYGRIVAGLYKKGKPIPTNDVWIAAVAMQHKLTLVTNDKHFKEVKALRTISLK